MKTYDLDARRCVHIGEAEARPLFAATEKVFITLVILHLSTRNLLLTWVASPEKKTGRKQRDLASFWLEM